MSWTAIAALAVFSYLGIGLITAIVFIVAGVLKKKEDISFPLFGWPLLLIMGVAVVVLVSVTTVYNKFLGAIWWLGGGPPPPQQNQQ